MSKTIQKYLCDDSQNIYLSQKYITSFYCENYTKKNIFHGTKNHQMKVKKRAYKSAIIFPIKINLPHSSVDIVIKRCCSKITYNTSQLYETSLKVAIVALIT